MSKQQNDGASLARDDTARLLHEMHSQAQTQSSELIDTALILTRCILHDCASARQKAEHVTPSHPRFQKDVMDVLLDRPLTQPQFSRDFFIR
jgi:hypothetical protein